MCGSNPNYFVFAGNSPNSHIQVQGNCPVGSYNGAGLAVFLDAGTATGGQAGRLQANAPTGLEFIGATANQISSVGINDGGDWGGGFYWAGGGVQTNDQTNQNPNIGMAFAAPSGYWGLQMICGKAKCSESAELAVQAVTLDVRETTPPNFAATGLWQASGWVRETWPFFAWSDSPSGVCDISATLNGLPIASTSSATHLSYAYHQCAAPAIDQTVDTSRYGNGALPLVLSSSDAAGVPASTSTTVHVDNLAPTVSLTGPTDAPSTAGTQYVTATASAGPSGIDGISCSVDGAPASWYPGTPAQVPVAGIGEHQVHCMAANNALDASGQRDWSAPAFWAIKIGEPTSSAISFGHIVDALRCHEATRRVRVPGRWVTVRRHHRRVKVRRRPHTKLVRVTRCHPRTAVRRVLVRVRVRRHHKWVWTKRHRRERVVLLPHMVHSTKLQVAHGKSAIVNGWVGTDQGVAVAGQPVTVLSAPDNGLDQFAAAATATTAADGTWSATLPAGPSRLIEAVYAGSSTTEASTSTQIALTVPAEVKLLRIWPRRVAWGGTVHIAGRLLGGYLPPGGALVRMRIGSGKAYTTYGVQEHVGGSGRFASTYTFGAGLAGVYRSFFLQAASLPMGSYAFAPASSRRITVLVGGHPAPPRRVPKRHRHRRRHHHRHR
ncbi:MAG: hypothetical protein ACRDNS_22985 [Trebonia sp.]